ncbi:MAG: double-strand break repair protein AddB [Pseudomonadota bacterium]
MNDPRRPYRSRVASIPPGAAFLPRLVDALVSGELIDGFNALDDPLALAGVTIWLPTRRAVRAIQGAFAQRMPGEVALLPRLRALGEVDEDTLAFDGPQLPVLSPAMDGLERHMILTRLVHAWADSLSNKDRDIFYGGGDIMMPASLPDAAWFAADLARLMDMVATEEVLWKDLKNLVDGEHSDWFGLTLEFLTIATKAWPRILQERGMQDAATLRAEFLNLQADLYSRQGSEGPVIAAGSTGSIPSTARLLKSIAQLDKGVVVLPGLDRDMSEKVWAKVDLPDNEKNEAGAAAGHPQYGLKLLLAELGVPRDEEGVRQLPMRHEDPNGHRRVRERLVSAAMHPAEETHTWPALFEALDGKARKRAFDGVKLVTAPGPREEALAIALALRETLDEGDHTKTCALVTPDRNLARRVAIEMRRFGVFIDDSAGQPLTNRPAGTFVRLVLHVLCRVPDPVAWAALLKHPLARFGMDGKGARHGARLFELGVLRGAISPPVPGRFLQRVIDIKQRAAAKERLPSAVRRMDDDDFECLEKLAHSLDRFFQPRTPVDDEGEMPDALTHRTVADLARLTIEALEFCATDHEDNCGALYAGPAGQVLHDLMGRLMDHGQNLAVPMDQWPDLFEALMATSTVRPRGGTHPRVAILGPIEARLQTFDRVVLGGLNEKTWPAHGRNDPFLSRPMKAALKLPLPERRTGLAAHDVQMMLGMNDVVLTRAAKLDGAPTVESRWVQRLRMVAGEEALKAMEADGSRFVNWAAAIDRPLGPPRPCPRPEPKPPVNERPRQLHITAVETWTSDPYAIYARHILHLDALEPLLRVPDAREKGTLYHAIVENYFTAGLKVTMPDVEQRFQALADMWFAGEEVPDEYVTLWKPRFRSIAHHFVHTMQSKVEPHVERTITEERGSTTKDLPNFRLSGRADRFDVTGESFHLYDYKTGSVPTASAVQGHDAPQMPLTAAMALRGAFGADIPAQAAAFSYVVLKPDDGFKIAKVSPASQEETQDLAQESWQRLARLIEAYDDPAKGYRSQARPSPHAFAGDYDHLARVKEWSLTEGEGDGDAGSEGEA